MSRARHKGSTNLVKPKGKGEPDISIPGKKVMQEAKSKSDGFKKGGGVKGQMADGDCAPSKRLDKAPRKASGGGVTMRGRSPLSAAASTSAASTKTTH